MAVKNENVKIVCMYLGNVLYHNFVICVFAIAFWQGTWTVVDLYVFPSDPLLSASVSTGFGILPSFMTTLLQFVLKKSLESKSTVTFLLVSRTYTYIMGWASVFLWRGMWNLLDIFTGINLHSTPISALVSAVVLAFLKSLKSVVFLPITEDVDIDRENYFRAATRFSVSAEKPLLLLCDAAVTCIIISPSVLTFFRGIWTLFDLILPQDPPLTVLYSFIIFIGCEIPFILLQYLLIRILQWAEKRNLEALKLCIDDIISVYLGITCVIGWRCIWNCISTFYLSDNTAVAAWSAHIIWYLMLTANLVSNAMVARGCRLDGVDMEGQYELCITNTLQRISIYCKNAQYTDVCIETRTQNETEISTTVTFT